MKLRSYLVGATLSSVMLMAGSAIAQIPAPAKAAADGATPPAAATQTPAKAAMPCGYDLMTEQERTDFRDKMRSFKTDDERQQFRMAHHAQMMQRANERGITLPAEPMKGCGPGMKHGKMSDAGKPQQQN
jgi:hypothetical protein